SEDLLAALNEEQRVIEYLKEAGELVETNDGQVISASQMLERFLFPPNQQYVPINKLSGGEKRRLFLLRVLMGAPNVLILDEPTNDLDVQTLAVLEEYLTEFNGCVIVVSHDRYFLDRTVNAIFALETGGNIRRYPGNYSVYLDYQKAKEKEAPEVKTTSVKTKTSKSKNKTNNKPRRLSNWERKTFTELEEQITKLEAEKEEVEKSLYNAPPGKVQEVKELYEKLQDLTDKIDVATEKWLELAERESG
ncbi:MAG: ATP-binding cassette domain-containing protein, partial [Spirulinaceae cyanobacterium]